MLPDTVKTIGMQETFKCKRCGACCKDRDVPLTLDDIFRLSDFFNMEPDNFFEAYCVEIAKSKDVIALPFLKRDGDACCFLEDNICKVHFVKPSACEYMPATMFGSLEYLRTQMPPECAIQNTKPDICDADKSRKTYVTAMLLTTIYYSKFGAFEFKHAKPFIYRILLSKRNREQIYRLTGNEIARN